jgi:alpha-ketoglutarate-dependent taurine dioxygenase
MSRKLSTKERAHLQKNGYVLTQCGSSRAFDELAISLGTPIPSRRLGSLKDVLEVKETEEAFTRSLSKVFGRGRFPFHTDMAHIPVPPKYVLLRSIGIDNSRKTFVMQVGEDALQNRWITALENDLWFVDGGRESFFTPIINTSIVRNRRVFRYDEEVMRPADRLDGESVRAMEQIKNHLPYVEFVLKTKECLIIDNWQTLHGRGAEPPKSDRDTRKLERYFVLEQQ